jgi:hypothetical protein
MYRAINSSASAIFAAVTTGPTRYSLMKYCRPKKTMWSPAPAAESSEKVHGRLRTRSRVVLAGAVCGERLERLLVAAARKVRDVVAALKARVERRAALELGLVDVGDAHLGVRRGEAELGQSVAREREHQRGL